MSNIREILHQDQIIPKILLGSGNNNDWTAADYKYYYDNRSEILLSPKTWWNPDSVEGYEQYILHMNRLANNYSVNQVENFIRDIGSIFAGISSKTEWYKAALGANSNKKIYMLYVDKSNGFSSSEAKSYMRYNNEGLNEIFLDDIDNQWTTHHHAAYMMTGYYLADSTEILLYGREIIWERNNYGDYYLGIVGAYQGMLLKNNPAMIENINLFFDVLGE